MLQPPACPGWTRKYFGLPSVRSKAVGLPGPGRWVKPFSTVLPMGAAPAVRICQTVIVTVVSSVTPCRLFPASRDMAISPELPPFDVVYLDDVTNMGPDATVTNARNEYVVQRPEDNGLRTKRSRRKFASEQAAFSEAICLRFWTEGFLSPSTARVEKLKRLTEAVLSSREPSPREMAAVIGTFVSCCLLRRPLLSILFRDFILRDTVITTSGERSQTACYSKLPCFLICVP